MRDEMQKIYKRQEGVTPERDQILSFLRGRNDEKVLEELAKRKLTDEEMLSLEGPIEREEMRKQLFHHMKLVVHLDRMASW